MNAQKKTDIIINNIDYPAPSEIIKIIDIKPIPKSNEYDLIINIDSIKNLQQPGWKIEYYNKTREEIKKFIQNSKMTIVSVLGNANRGKTHILQKLSGAKLKPGYQNITKGLSIKLNGKDIILLDTAGTNAPLLAKSDKERPPKHEMDHIHLCQIITNYILQAFVIKQAHVLICVIGMLTASEQSFLNKIKKFSKNKKKLIVIHNLIKCTTKEDINKYNKEILNKMISIKLIPRKIPVFEEENHKLLFNEYYVEEDDEDVMHFIYCNDENKFDDLNYYNKSTISFIQKCIKVQVIKPVNIIEELKEHIKEYSSLVLQEEIKEIKEENDCIKCMNEIEPKNILYDGGDDIIFIGKEFEPKYRYYVKDDSLIIEVELCSKYNDLKIKQKFDKNTKETIVIITGERIIEKAPNYEEYYNFGNKRENYKRFKLEVKIKLNNLGIKHLNKDFEKNMKFGILFLTNKFIK